MSKMWSYHRLRGTDYTILYDGSEVGTIGSKAIVERLVDAANACAMVPSDVLKELDVERLRQEHDALLAACEAAQQVLEVKWGHADAVYAPEALHAIVILGVASNKARAKGGAK